MRKIILLAALTVLTVTLSGCGKIGVSGRLAHTFGDWAAVTLPSGCVPKQIAAEEGADGVVVMCEDGRVFR